MAVERWQVFVDTHVLISGLLSSTGASAAILDLAEAEELIAVVSRQALVEADRVFLEKFPDFVGRYRRFIKNLAPFLAADPSPGAVKAALEAIKTDDAPILAAAKAEKVQYLVTLDKKHFHTPRVRSFIPCPVVTPSELILEFRRTWEG